MNSRFSHSALRGFELVFRPWMARRVDAVHMTGPPSDPPPDRPLLLAPNHVSWWDGFVALEIRRVLRPHAPMYTLMLQSELRRFPYFGLIGAVGMDPRSPGSVGRALRFLQARLAARPDSMVVLFPQGRIWPSHRRPLGFRRGIELFAARLRPIILPVGIHMEPLGRPSPSIFVGIGEPLAGDASAAEAERAVEAELDRILEFVGEHGEGAAAAWPPRAGPPVSATGEERA